MRGLSIPRGLRCLRRDRRGIAATEFALIAPVLITFMMGVGDLLYGMYINSIVLGAVQQAGRDNTLQSNAGADKTAPIDNRIMAMVRYVAPAATFTSSRVNYSSFSDVSKPEPLSPDKGVKGAWDAVGDCFIDLNNNGTFDQDGGRDGVGGANDVAKYTITVTYPRVFPIAGFLGWGNNGTTTAQTVLKNQPYAAQGSPPTPRICK